MTKYGKALIAVSVFDLVFTLIGIHFGWMYEWSIILSHVLATYGAVAFSVCHVAPLIFGVVLLETLWCKMPERRPTWRIYYLFVLGAYIGIWGSVILYQYLYLLGFL